MSQSSSSTSSRGPATVGPSLYGATLESEVSGKALAMPPDRLIDEAPGNVVVAVCGCCDDRVAAAAALLQAKHPACTFLALPVKRHDAFAAYRAAPIKPSIAVFVARSDEEASARHVAIEWNGFFENVVHDDGTMMLPLRVLLVPHVLRVAGPSADDRLRWVRALRLYEGVLTVRIAGTSAATVWTPPSLPRDASLRTLQRATAPYRLDNSLAPLLSRPATVATPPPKVCEVQQRDGCPLCIFSAIRRVFKRSS